MEKQKRKEFLREINEDLKRFGNDAKIVYAVLEKSEEQRGRGVYACFDSLGLEYPEKVQNIREMGANMIAAQARTSMQESVEASTKALAELTDDELNKMLEEMQAGKCKA